MRDNVRIVPVTALAEPERAAMYALYADHYDATDPSMFARDLDAKDFALLLAGDEGALAGFTTMAVGETVHEGQRVRTIFSGDTIIDPRHWGRQDLAFAWIAFAGRVKAEAPDVPLYWFLIVKGHRTYRYLSAFSINFQPHWERTSSAWQASLMRQLGRERFGADFDADAGVVRFAPSRGHLKPGLAEIDAAEAQRPDVALFLARNPGFREGHELVCLTELSEANLRPIARRQFLKGLRS